MEALEDRWMPSTFNWVGPASGDDFNTGADWQNTSNSSTGVVPGLFDTASIPVGDSVNVAQASETVSTLTLNGTLDVQANTFTAGTLTLASGATLQVDGGTALVQGGTLSGAVNVAAAGTLQFDQGTITVNNTASLTGTGLYQLGVSGFGPTLTVNSALTLPTNFTFQGGTLNGSGNLTIVGTFNWLAANTSATMSGSGTTTVQAGATVNIAGTPPFTTANLTRTLTNHGTINLGGTGNFGLNNGGVLHNMSDGTVNITADMTISGGGVLTNDGTIVKTSALGGTTTVGDTLNNTSTGTVHVQTGQLTLNGGGTNAAGTFTADSGATVTFSGGTYTLNANSQMTGAGLFDVAGATVAVAGATSVSNLQFDSGTINGAGTLTPTAFTWNGGTLVAPTVIPANDTLAIAGGGSKNLNGSLTNNGTVNLTSTTDIGSSNTPTITNNGTFNIQSDVSLTGNAVFTNAGTLTKSSPTTTGTTGFTPQLNNSGTVDVQSGTLQLNNGGASTHTGPGTGVWQAESLGTLDIHSGTLTVGDGTTFTGAGVEQTSFFGTMQVNGAVTAQNFTIGGGDLTGAGTFTVTGTLTWSDGNVNDPSGTIIIPVGATLLLKGNNDKSLTGGTLNLFGTTTWQDGGNWGCSNATINNEVGATFTILNGQNIGGAGGHINNAGTMTRPAGVTGQTSITVFDSFTNTGTLSVLGGILYFATLTQTAGTTTVGSGATLQGTVQLNGGTLTGTGTVQGTLNNAATVVPGGPSSAGMLNINGNYTQTAAGTLLINVAGTTAGSGFGQLSVGNTASLAGTLRLNSINSFTAAPGETFPVVLFTSGSGSLALTGTLSPGAGDEFTTSRGAASFTVAVTQIPPPPPPPAPGPTPPPPSPTPGKGKKHHKKHKKHH